MGMRMLRRLYFMLATLVGAASSANAAPPKDCAAIKAQADCKDDCSWDKKKKVCAAKVAAPTGALRRQERGDGAGAAGKLPDAVGDAAPIAAAARHRARPAITAFESLG